MTLEFVQQLAAQVWRCSWMAAGLILLVLAVRAGCGERLPAKWRYGLWLLVVARLLLPNGPGSALSAYNLVPSRGLATPASADTVAPPDLALAPGVSTILWQPPGAPDQAAAAQASSPIPVAATPVVAPTTVAPSSANPRLPAVTVPPLPRGQTGVPLSWAQALALAWLAVALALGFRLAFENHRFSRRLRASGAAANPRVRAIWDRCRRVAGLQCDVSLWETDLVDNPALFGFLHPSLLLPRGLSERLADRELEHVFLHELAHLRRGDVPIAALLAVLQLCHWFNPFVRVAFRRMRADREQACDAAAMTWAGPGSSRAYGETLLKLLESPGMAAPAPGLVGILEGREEVEHRIRGIASFGRCPSPKWALAFWLLLAVMGLTDAQPKVSVAASDPPPNASAKPSDDPGTPVRPGGTFVAVVQDFARGNAIPDASATLGFLSLDGDGRTEHLRSNHEGQFRLRVPAHRFRHVQGMVWADGYEPRTVVWKAADIRPTMTVRLKRVPDPVEVLLLTPGGSPASGGRLVTVAGAARPYLDSSSPGKVQQPTSLRFVYAPADRDPEPVDPAETANADGRVRVRPSYVEGFAASHESGYAVMPLAELDRTTNTVTLIPWGRVEGRFLAGNRPGSAHEIHLFNPALPEDTNPISVQYRTQTDADGRFALERVPAGDYLLSVTSGPNAKIRQAVSPTQVARVQVGAGQSATMSLGGKGRPVQGKVVASTKKPPVLTGRLSPIAAASDRPAYGLQFDGGRFQVLDVIPGRYRLTILVNSVTANPAADYASLVQGTATRSGNGEPMRRYGMMASNPPTKRPHPYQMDPKLARRYGLIAPADAETGVAADQEVEIAAPAQLPSDDAVDLGTFIWRPAAEE